MQANSLKDLLQSKIDDLEKQVLSRVNSIEEGKPGLRNETEQRGRVESTLTSLHQRITDLEKGSKVKRRDYARGAIEDFFFFFSLWRYQITVREGNGRKKNPILCASNLAS